MFHNPDCEFCFTVQQSGLGKQICLTMHQRVAFCWIVWSSKLHCPSRWLFFYYFLSRCLHKKYIDALFTIFLFQGLLFG
jgi:hypothetical protein